MNTEIYHITKLCCNTRPLKILHWNWMSNEQSDIRSLQVTLGDFLLSFDTLSCSVWGRKKTWRGNRESRRHLGWRSRWRVPCSRRRGRWRWWTWSSRPSPRCRKWACRCRGGQSAGDRNLCPYLHSVQRLFKSCFGYGKLLLTIEVGHLHFVKLFIFDNVSFVVLVFEEEPFQPFLVWKKGHLNNWKRHQKNKPFKNWFFVVSDHY